VRCVRARGKGARLGSTKVISLLSIRTVKNKVKEGIARKSMSMSMIRLLSLSFLFVTALFTPNAAATLDLSGTVSGFTGFSNFEVEQTIGGTDYLFGGQVDYAVYEPDSYSGSISFPDDEYVYAYQFFNSNDSDVAVNVFSVGLSPSLPVDSAGNASFDILFGEPGGIPPTDQSVEPQSLVLYLFLSATGQSVGSGDHSAVLLFSSESGPTMGFGSISGGVLGSTAVELPTPIPEPATLVLLLAGSLIALKRKRRSI
jgi:hypothetical protein